MITNSIIYAIVNLSIVWPITYFLFTALTPMQRWNTFTKFWNFLVVIEHEVWCTAYLLTQICTRLQWHMPIGSQERYMTQQYLTYTSARIHFKESLPYLLAWKSAWNFLRTFIIRIVVSSVYQLLFCWNYFIDRSAEQGNQILCLFLQYNSFTQSEKYVTKCLLHSVNYILDLCNFTVIQSHSIKKNYDAGAINSEFRWRMCLKHNYISWSTLTTERGVIEEVKYLLKIWWTWKTCFSKLGHCCNWN